MIENAICGVVAVVAGARFSYKVYNLIAVVKKKRTNKKIFTIIPRHLCRYEIRVVFIVNYRLFDDCTHAYAYLISLDFFLSRKKPLTMLKFFLRAGHTKIPHCIVGTHTRESEFVRNVGITLSGIIYFNNLLLT